MKKLKLIAFLPFIAFGFSACDGPREEAAEDAGASEAVEEAAEEVDEAAD